MLILTKSVRCIDFSQLMHVYAQSNSINGEALYPQYSTAEQRLMAEQDLYSYLRAVFCDGSTMLAIWAPMGRYKAALRLEPYLDGMIITALETAPNERGKGYAKSLLSNVINAVECSKIYAHIHKNNKISIRVHEACGFTCEKDHAVYLDGSVSYRAYTYIYTPE